ncbi:dual specificity protein phosphatase 26 isoform X1 [Hemicordylus capensis]|uniref:dual specificity protein phosphatase 26 isoform X1 n=2 Tax=Hemicordylus capensis TaxID=884348 RepID=UPI0023045067|nr:dual specificity protein phosphatase 26 isoform X1 [Hemicordylus capensis]
MILSSPSQGVFGRNPATASAAAAAARERERKRDGWLDLTPSQLRNHSLDTGPTVGGGRSRNTVPAPSQSPREPRDATGGLAAPMAFMSRFSRNRSRTPSWRTHDATSSHPILSVFELERLLYTGKTACNHADEVWPGLYLGDQDIAANRRELAHLGITHILNASHSKWRGGAEYYDGTGICYLGIEAHDSPTFDMSPYFEPAADFIHKALIRSRGRILVHCAVGVSRSATLVLAYLMIYHHLTLVEAIKTVKDHRGIIPNRGFLRQLSALDSTLRLKQRP